jgi:hypothetical protein
MRLPRPSAFVLFLAACGEPAKTPPVVDEGQLSHCFSEAYGGPDVDHEIARCEEQRFGTEWRKKPAPDGTVGGNLDPRLIQAGIEARMPHVRACYGKGVRRDPNLRGEVKVRFVIDPAGHVTGATDLGSKFRDREVIQCIVGEVSSMRFPRPEDGAVTVVHPFLLTPGETQH